MQFEWVEFVCCLTVNGEPIKEYGKHNNWVYNIYYYNYLKLFKRIIKNFKLTNKSIIHGFRHFRPLKRLRRSLRSLTSILFDE